MRLILVLIATIAATTPTCTVILRYYWRADALDFLVLLLDLFCVCLWIRVQPRLTILESVHNLLLFLGIELLAQTLVLARALSGRPHRMQISVESILRIHALLDFLVLVGKLLGFFDHLLDLLLRQAALVVGDGDLLTLASGLVLCTHIQDTVGVNLKGHLDLRLTTGRRWDPSKLELAQQVVVLGHWPLALENLNVHCRLVILVSREDLRLLRRDHSVPVDELCHHPPDSLDAQGERGHIKKHPC